jgi:hypothetical protein
MNIRRVSPKCRHSSHGILASPLASRGLVLGHIGLVDVSDLGHEGIVWVGVSQERADGEEHLRDGKRRAPLVLKDVDANASVGVDVWVVNSSCEVNLGRLERIISGEVDVQKVDTSRVRRVVWSHDSCLPMEQILLVERAGRAVGGRVLAEVDQFLLDSFKSHNLVSNL